MSSEQVLQQRVGELRTRIRMLITQSWVCVGLTWAALAGLALVAATKFQWWTDAVDYLWALFLIGAIAGLIMGWTRRITPLVAAQIADERAGLKERLSTAVELSAMSGAGERGEIADAQIADAAQHADELRAGRVLPWQAPKQWRYLAAAVAILLAAIYIPNLPIFQSAQDRIDREVMRTEGTRIQQVAKEVEKKAKKQKGDEDGEILRRIAQNMRQLGKDQERGRISKKQAMLKMNELQKQLKDAENRVAGGRAEKSLDQVTADLRAAADRQRQRGNGEAARQMQQMADNLQKRDFEGAKRQLEEMARRMQSGQMTPQEAEQAAQTLQQMAQSMEKSGLDQAAQQMKDAARELEKSAQAGKQIQQQMAQARSDAERQQLQQQMQQAMAQGAQQAGQQCQKAGGT
jgi:hypothetical protein